MPPTTTLTRPPVDFTPDLRWVRPLLRRGGPVLAVFLVAVAAAVVAYVRFRAAPRLLWEGTEHDRHAHYLYGLKLALALKHGRIGTFLMELHRARVWPPLHGLLLSLVLLVGGFDYRLGVLPSLAAWAAAAVLAFLAGRRTVRRGGTAAGLVAALLVLASPAHRAFATDIMLESLGACLTLLVVYAYLATVQEDGAWAGRLLALSLTALFFTKYNYWALVAFGLVAAQLSGRLGDARLRLAEFIRQVDWRARLREARRPSTYLLAGVLLLTGAVYLWGREPITYAGRSVRLFPPYNFFHAAYAVVFLRAVGWWWREGRTWARGLDGRIRALVYGHVWPVALTFLLPQHLGYFVWYLSPYDSVDSQKASVVNGLREYGRFLATDYHAGPAAAVIVAVLCLAGLAARRRLRSGAGAVFWVLVLSAALAASHPNRKSRFLHSWVAVGWVGAGAGVALLGQAVPLRWRSARPWLTAGVAAGLVIALGPSVGRPGHAPEGGPRPQGPSALDLTDAYLPALDSSRRALVLGTIPMKFLADWTVIERYGSLDRIETHWFGFGPPGKENRRGFLQWLAATPCDALVFVDRIPPNVWVDPACPQSILHGELRDLVSTQTVFAKVSERRFPEIEHGCQVTVWRRIRPAD